MGPPSRPRIHLRQGELIEGGVSRAVAKAVSAVGKQLLVVQIPRHRLMAVRCGRRGGQG